MTLTSGRYRFGSDTGSLYMRTTRQGLASAAGHDLLIAVTRWSGTADIDMDAPERSQAQATIDATSFEVREGTGGVKALTDHDRQDIKSTAERKILAVARYPTISFVSTAVAVRGTAIRIRGDLTIRGVSRPLDVDAHMTADGAGRLVGAVTVIQTDWGISPYKGFLGALKVADAVSVGFDFALA